MRSLVLPDFHRHLSGEDKVVPEVDLIPPSCRASGTAACDADPNFVDRLTHRGNGVEFGFQVLKIECKLQNIDHCWFTRLRLDLPRCRECDGCGRCGDP